ncbi:MAG: hypothetical protein WBW79_11220, partial [Desulfocapsaceae bacterium]
AVRLTFQSIIETVGLEVMQRCPVLFGLGIVENAYHNIIRVKAIKAENICNEEKKLLALAKAQMATLPFDDIDVLIIDQIGKDISGTGMDINVIGRNRDILKNFISLPRVKRIFVRDLSERSEGNAIGIGLADFTTSRLVTKMDNHKTWVNSITGISPEKGAIPIYFDKDEDALLACFQTIGDVAATDARVVHIKNTLELHHFSVSKAYAADIEADENLTRIGEWETLSFNSQGNLE